MTDIVHPLQAFREAQTPTLTQTDLAIKLGVNKQSVCRWESAERFPEREHWSRIKEVTGLSPEDLYAAEKAAHAPAPMTTAEATETPAGGAP